MDSVEARRKAIQGATPRQHLQSLCPVIGSDSICASYRLIGVHHWAFSQIRGVERFFVSTLFAVSDLSLSRRGPIDLEAKFEPSLLNTAIYLLGLSQQVSTFAINFQVN